MGKFKRYEAYKDSGIEWLGEIPEHWEVKRLKYLIKEHSGNGFPVELQGNKKAEIPFYKVSDLNTNGIFLTYAKHYVTKKLVKTMKWNLIPRNSVIAAKIGEALKKNNRKIIKHESVIDNNCVAIEPKNINYKYNYYLHTLIDFDWFLNPGAVPSISIFKYKNFKVVLPSKLEQIQIANFLDKKTAQIDKAIRLKEELIERLKEKRQVLIHNAVTSGLNPNVKMKDSGIEWIGKIPEHWELRRAKWLFKQEKREVREEDEIVTCFRDGQVTLRKKRRTDGFTNALKEHGYQGIRKGDLVIHAMDAFAGAIGISDSDGKATPVYSVCTPKIFNINVYYYAFYLRSLAFRGFIESLAKGIRERSTDFRFSDFKELFMPLPPLEEQNKIVIYIEKSLKKIDHAITLQQKQIEKLKEYKAIIIDSAVTGKVKVAKEV